MRYFSPEWRIDLKTGECMGLLPVRPAGGLVNLPAFESMAAVAAKLAVRTPNTFPAAAGRNTKPKNTMSEQIKDACVKAGLITEEESAADNAAELLTQRLEALRGAESNATASVAAAVTAKAEADAAKADADKAKAELAKLLSDSADEAVKTAQASGKIAPQDTASAGFWRKQIAQPGEAGAQARAALNSLASRIPVASSSVQAGADAPNEPSRARDAQVGARASAIAREKGIPYSAAWSAAEKEIAPV